MPTHTVDLQRLYAALNAKRVEQGKSWRQVGRELALPASRFTRMGRGGGISLDTFVTLITWLEVDAAAFLEDLDAPTPPPPPPPPSLSERLDRYR